MFSKLLSFPSLITLLLASGGFTALAQSDRMDTVDLDIYEIQSEFSFDDIQVELSRSELNENLLGIYGATQLQDLAGLAPNLAFINSDTRGFGDHAYFVVQGQEIYHRIEQEAVELRFGQLKRPFVLNGVLGGHYHERLFQMVGYPVDRNYAAPPCPPIAPIASWAWPG